MDYAPSSSTSAVGSFTPPTSRQAHQQSRRSPWSSDVRNGDGGSAFRPQSPPTSPEVISNLITSLSAISKPANNLFEKQSPSLPATLFRQGSFGVDYGAYGSPSLRIKEEDVSLDELAATPPVIRTAPPPSGLSPLTAPISPRSPHRESSGGLRSLLRSSRPSSRSSASSSHDDTRSIGNLSIERGAPPAQELHRQPSQDSWGKRSGRNHKGLMYMSSKEQLRATEAERKRSSFGTVGGGHDGMSGPLSPRQDPSLVDTAISEEPASLEPTTRAKLPERTSSLDPAYQRLIPTRDSSLRKTGSSAKRSSQRSTQSKRDSESNMDDSIPEHETRDYLSDMSLSKWGQPTRSALEADTRRRRDEDLYIDSPTPTRLSSTSRSTHGAKTPGDSPDVTETPLDEGAPYPAIYSSRRRSARSVERRPSGRTTPEPGDMLKLKRSSSKLNRLSFGPKSPEEEKPAPVIEPTTQERPRSVDSIDDAVESYLCSPRLSQKIKHPQTGRVISFSEVGDSEGSAVFCCVGMGLTRYIMAFYDELALTLKLRLITPDRPGVGDSESYADGTATPLSWPGKLFCFLMLFSDLLTSYDR